ncbi:MAG: preprotein translocase subunit SecY, partial [Armatimonadota bacterium]
MFAIFTLGVHIPVPIAGQDPAAAMERLKDLPIFQLLDTFGGGALRKLSIFALSLNPYITASIIIQILTTAIPKMKQELQEGGEYARKNQNRRTRFLTLALCFIQGWGTMQLFAGTLGLSVSQEVIILIFWTAGTMFTLWIGEQISERGIGNGVSLIIFAGILVGLPHQLGLLVKSFDVDKMKILGAALAFLIFVAATWAIVYFTTAQRRIPIAHMRRMQGTKAMGGGTSYLPLSINMAGVLPIIFAFSLLSIPDQFATLFGYRQVDPKPLGAFFHGMAEWINPASTVPISDAIPIHRGFVGVFFFTGLIFFFTYFWTAIQYNVEDIAN